MWKGKMTKELEELFIQYAKENYGTEPDGYDDVYYDDLTYDKFVGYIKEALRRHCCIEDVMEDMLE